MIPEIAMQEDMVRQASHDHNWELELRTLIREHGAREGTALAAYEALAEQASDAGIQYIAKLILEDEARHHRMISEMLRRVEGDLAELDLQPSVPGSVMPGSDVFDATATLLELEKDDERELRRLRRLMRKEPTSSLLPLLVDLLLHDTAKHLTMLQFVQDQA